MLIKRCAVCSDIVQKNITNLYVRESDGEVFNVCRICTILQRANDTTVNNYLDTLNIDETEFSKRKYAPLIFEGVTKPPLVIPSRRRRH